MSANAQAPAASNGQRVLVVDDASPTRAVLRKIFTGQGYEVIEAENGEDAIKLYNAQRPTLVTMEVHLEKVSGLGATEVIRKIDPNARIIICSSEYAPQYILKSLSLGAKGYVPKPFTSETILAAVAKAMA